MVRQTKLIQMNSKLHIYVSIYVSSYMHKNNFKIKFINYLTHKKYM